MKIPKELPQIPLIDGLRCEDHATYIARPGKEEQAFIDYWKARGLHQYPAIVTSEFPARHIAMVRDLSNHGSCEQMIGLSVSDDPNSPITKSITLYGGHRIDETGLRVPGKLQHIAYEVNFNRTMKDVRKELESKGVSFMTPILSYEDASGAVLEQMFVASEFPWGPFVEIIRRGPGRDNEQFKGFNSIQIDNLYRGYDDHSRRLIEVGKK